MPLVGLEDVAGRFIPRRSDSHSTRARLIAAVGDYAGVHGAVPERLADVAAHAGLSVATAYRHFQSNEDVVRAHLLLLPQRAVELFEQTDRRQTGGAERLHRWNRAWAKASLEHGPSAVRLRSPAGFLERRARCDPAVCFVCDHVEPLLVALTDDHLPALVVWNAVSDPREVVDLAATLKWSLERIARFITEVTVASMTRQST